MLESEMDDHLGYKRHERSDSSNSRNDSKPKTIRGKYGEFQVDVPPDRASNFEPEIVLKRKKGISGIEDRIISMHAKEMKTTQSSDIVGDICGFEISKGIVSDITDKLLPQIEEQQHHPLSEVYPIVFIDAIHFSVRDDGVIHKPAAYIVLGIHEKARKEVLTIEVEENESSKYRLNVPNSLKNQDVNDTLVLYSDGLAGLKEAIATAFPNTKHQLCIVHMVHNTLNMLRIKT